MHIPLSTYRVQLNKELPFAKIEEILGYLKKLGISDVYTSPIMQAQPGSSHGYDATNYEKINPDLGGYDGFKRFCLKLQENSLNLCVDIVPNHMASTEHNPYWQDVVKNREKSEHAFLFDINWAGSTDEKLSYRRFFDINELVCMRVEDDEVFKKTHQLLFSLVKENLIQGLRIDHIDGLRSPAKYLKNLKAHTRSDFYIIVEKILGFAETLPDEWPIDGTTGYDFLNRLNQVFVEPAGLKKIISHYQEVTHAQKSVEQIRQDSIILVIEKLFSAEFTNLVNQLKEFIDEYDDEVGIILLQMSAFMPIYRIYGNQEQFSDDEKDLINKIADKINTKRRDLLERIKQVILLQFPPDLSEQQKQLWARWLSNWQVLTGPLMAKGFEDTTCYNFNAFLSLNEVGSAPEYYTRAGHLDDFHEYNELKQQKWPYSLNATSTHDTKRSEDVRARLNVLSELKDEWVSLSTRWIKENHSKKTLLNQEMAPDVIDEFMIYQTLLGIWPIHDANSDLQQRIHNFLTKALRERKSHTTWFAPNEAYEKATMQFFDTLIASQTFLESFTAFQKKVAFFGMYNSLAQIVLKTTAPGVPDFYQGCESWCFSLVDPDNRHPIDYQSIKALESHDSLAQLLKNWEDGRIKFNTTCKLLEIRNSFKEVFLHGKYIPLSTQGGLAKHVIAFAREFDNSYVIVVALRFVTDLLAPFEHWSNAAFSQEDKIILPKLYKREFHSLLTGEKIISTDEAILVADVLKTLPFNIF
ncbi:Maltooligosyl trehalose synthase [Legionella beliardensis]|uniref:Maltooligosyl trehalose synthase n=1 Tax=Legionella beliardensis TaxID=91822 RepID=A0A378HY94_9GAMM|nr:malto-oligosyltrehalose synthase [Legionella beliardensis]STX27859.1 Maltooligosyl trehalose synthase [Legionella beliardensis]